jgi:hypothetical protein
MEKVTLAKVLEWLRAAMEAAQADPGDTGGNFTALSYRELRVEFVTETGGLSVYMTTRNREFSGYEERIYHAITEDGVEVTWRAELGVPTGASWLPWEFFDWIRRKAK